MTETFAARLSRLRKGSGLNQRTVASQLKISQALLSHYENGVREPGLEFVIRACSFYCVSADYLLGRTAVKDGLAAPEGSRQEDGLSAAKRRICGCVSMLFDRFSDGDCREAGSALALMADHSVLELMQLLGVTDGDGAAVDAVRCQKGRILFEQARLSLMDYAAAHTDAMAEIARRYPERYSDLTAALEAVYSRIGEGGISHD